MRERIRVNGEPLSEELFAKYFFEVWERLEADPKVCPSRSHISFSLCMSSRQTLTPLTPVFPIYFRLLTLLAFHAFLSLGVDATVLEVGIGGLYDSTNIVPQPITTGISSLGLDHQAVLGNTIQEIAKNKAGIYKKGVPALSVPQDQAGDVLEQVAKDNGAIFSVVPPLPAGVELGIRGEHQRINASLAVALAKSFLRSTGRPVKGAEEDLPESFKDPLKRTRWPGRCQTIKAGQVTWMLDGAHTTESLRSCGEWAWGATEEGGPNVLIFNCSGGRAGETLLGALLDAGAKTGRKTREQLGMDFQRVIFCTNVTYTSGGFKGGKWSLCGISMTDTRPHVQRHRPQ